MEHWVSVGVYTASTGALDPGGGGGGFPNVSFRDGQQTDLTHGWSDDLTAKSLMEA